MNYGIEIQIALEGADALSEELESANVTLDIGQNLFEAVKMFQLLRPNRHSDKINYIRLTLVTPENGRKQVLAFMSDKEEW